MKLSCSDKTLTMILGYGNIVPSTFWGRLFCVLFAMVGIPLTVSVIADFGVLLASAVSALHHRIKAYFPSKVCLKPTNELQFVTSQHSILSGRFTEPDKLENAMALCNRWRHFSHFVRGRWRSSFHDMGERLGLLRGILFLFYHTDNHWIWRFRPA